MKYHVLIMDLEENKVLLDAKGNAVIASVAEEAEQNGAHSVSLLEGTLVEAAGAVLGARQSIRNVLAVYPDAELIVELAEREGLCKISSNDHK